VESSGTVKQGDVITSLALRSIGLTPRASVRTTMSRSVTTPGGLPPPSITGISPQSCATIDEPPPAAMCRGRSDRLGSHDFVDVHSAHLLF
jgi:hypothetical protein